MVEPHELLAKINSYYGSNYLPHGVLYIRDERFFLYTGGVIPLENVWQGLHIANTDLSLTIEGAQLFGKTAGKKHAISPEDTISYFKGEDLKTECDDGFVILTCNGKIIGCGLVESNTMKNLIPKSRLIK
ncbi:MAG: hypothetical protein KKD39_02760 [Candidatus Altiarchaeota archaeon]|nr:hypothetical protein [Candidatus Altiarchaeota archaeon]